MRKKSSTSLAAPEKSLPPPPPIPPVPAALKNRNAPKSGKLVKKSRKGFPAVSLSEAYQRDKQTGEAKIDHTDFLHSLVHTESTEDVPKYRVPTWTDPALTVSGQKFISKLSEELWQDVFRNLSLADMARLSYSCKAFRHKLRGIERDLDYPENADERSEFLLGWDGALPNHLYCFHCGIYHRRLQPGKETLKPMNKANPIVNCPSNFNPRTRPSRTRITSGRALPFTFAQLMCRAQKFGPEYGISTELMSRRWKDRDTDWIHNTRYTIDSNQLLMRVISTGWCPPLLQPAALRKFLYNSSEDYHPYFSTCPHWRDGDLMTIVKCALSHIPQPESIGGVKKVAYQVRAHVQDRHESPIVRLCNVCRPIRRCPDCPTEYMIELKWAEDTSEKDPKRRFKQALVVTRWSALGDGKAPQCPEWVACTGGVIGKPLDSRQMNGMGRREAPSKVDAEGWVKTVTAKVDQDVELDEESDWLKPKETQEDGNVAEMPPQEEEEEWEGSGYDSIGAIGKRAISGTFEAQFDVMNIPGQRIIDLNPSRKRKGEAGNLWF